MENLIANKGKTLTENYIKHLEGGVHMSTETYIYNVKAVNMKNNKPFNPGRINVLVGANNCGKTQLLKDMLVYITGKRDNTIILDSLDIPYPKTVDLMTQTYNMKIVEKNQSKQLRHISPTLDGEPEGLIHSDITAALSNWLEYDKRQFRNATGAGLVTYLNTDNRLKLAMSQPVQQNLNARGAKNVLEALYESDTASISRVEESIKKIFGVDIFLNPYNLGTLEFRVGINSSEVSKEPQEAYKQLSKKSLLDLQGDGIRSVLGIISSIISVKKPIILLDEPEAFLHPPQALQLGELISELVDTSQQIFIATHSADFLRGLIGTTRDAVIIHLNRFEDVTERKILDSATLAKIVTDPLLSSSRVLEGMFYKGVVATEADADTVFYQRLFQKIGTADEVHFVNAHNKQTLKKIIEPYQKLGIKFAMIADADVIRDKRDFLDILQITSDESLKRQILQEREMVLRYFQQKSKSDILCELKTKTMELVEQTVVSETTSPDEIESLLFNFRLTLKKLREDSDELAELKKNGRSLLPPEIQTNFDSLWKLCSDIGVFIVPVGELESWLVDYGIKRTSNKAKWISDALNKLFELEYDKDKYVWSFVDALRKYLVG